MTEIDPLTPNNLPMPITVDFADFPPAVGESFRELLELPTDNSAFYDPVVYDFGGPKTYAYKIQDNFHETGKPYENILLVDVDETGASQGSGVVTCPLDPSESPYVGYTETWPKYRQQGLGRRRLLIMNDLCLEDFGRPLHSAPDGYSEPAAKRLWEALVRDGLAVKYTDNGHDRYHFLGLHTEVGSNF